MPVRRSRREAAASLIAVFLTFSADNPLMRGIGERTFAAVPAEAA